MWRRNMTQYVERMKNKNNEGMGQVGRRKATRQSQSQSKEKWETLKKTNTPGTELHCFLKHRLSEQFFPELNSLMKLKKKSQLPRPVKSVPTPTHYQLAVISSNCKWIIRFPLGKMLVKKIKQNEQGNTCLMSGFAFPERLVYWCIMESHSS